MARLVTSLIGAALFLYGVIAALSPLPAGIPLIVLGMIMIATANPAARPLIRRLRAKWRLFDIIVAAIGKRDPKHFKEVVDETEPPHDAQPTAKSE